MSDLYILDGEHNPVPCDDSIVWAKWFEKTDRVVAQAVIPNGQMISTVFLGIGDADQLFETMVFSDQVHFDDIYCRRCATWAEAEQQHEQALKWANRKPRGFATMTAEQRKAISSMGGKKVHELGIAYEFTRETASAAGKKGGKSLAQNREHMSEIGRKGLAARRAKKLQDERLEEWESRQ